MKKTYIGPNCKPINELAEGIYMASGESCYAVTAKIHQKPETGRGDYRIKIEGKHIANHTKDTQVLHIYFNLPVEYKESSGRLLQGDGSNSLHIQYHYHQNPTDHLSLGDLAVRAEPGLSITKASITD